jgi:hypothetical protein
MVPWVTLSLVRVDSALTALPLIILWLAVFRGSVPDSRLRRQAGIYAGAAVGAWALYHLWRYVYFGRLVSNTFVAQDFHPWERLRFILIQADQRFATDTAAWVWEMLQSNLGMLFLVLLALLPFLRYTNLPRFIFQCTAAVLLAGIAQFLLFGPARLDLARTTTHLALMAAIAVPAALLELRWRTVGIGWPVVLLIFHPGVLQLFPRTMYWVGFAPFDDRVSLFRDMQQQYDLYRPLTANPDLGKVSYIKEFNIFDTAMLGDPVVAQGVKEPEVLREYFFLVQPDLIESHEPWNCLNGVVFADPRWKKLYTPKTEIMTPWLEANCQHHPQVRWGSWHRKAMEPGSQSPDRLLHDWMRTALVQDNSPDKSAVLAHITGQLE